MKIKLFILFQLCAGLLVSQNTIKGTLLDKGTGDPIFGVLVMLDGNPYCVSEYDGTFSVEVDKNFNLESIQFSFTHMAYHSKTKSFEELKSNPIIYLEEKLTQLEEVFITQQSNSLEDLLKEARDDYSSSCRKDPYWSSINYKHLIYLNGNPRAFLELYGHIFMLGKEQPFKGSMIVPDAIRRTSESDSIVHLWLPRNKNVKQLGHTYVNSGWNINYNFFDSSHPLLSKNKSKYEYSLLNNSDTLTIAFKQKSKISYQGRELDFIQGELFINKEDFSLYQVDVSFRFEKLYYAEFHISYQHIAEQIFPKHLEGRSYRLGSYNELKNGKVIITNSIDFNNIHPDTNDAYRDYKDTYHNGPWLAYSEAYDSSQWRAHELNEKYSNALMDISKEGALDHLFFTGSMTKEFGEQIEDYVREKQEPRGDHLRKRMEHDLGLKK